MATEIERKFLLANVSWRTRYSHRERIRDGLIATAAGCKCGCGLTTTGRT